MADGGFSADAVEAPVIGQVERQHDGPPKQIILRWTVKLEADDKTTRTVARSPVFSAHGSDWFVRLQRAPFVDNLPGRNYSNPCWGLFLCAEGRHCQASRVAFRFRAVWRNGDTGEVSAWKDVVFFRGDDQLICRGFKYWARHDSLLAKELVAIEAILKFKRRFRYQDRPPIMTSSGSVCCVQPLPFPVLVGSYELREQYVWRIPDPTLNNRRVMEFWSSKVLKRRPRLLKFDCRQVAELSVAHGVWMASPTESYCNDLRLFLVQAAHAIHCGQVTLPYDLVLFGLDMEDGSDDDASMEFRRSNQFPQRAAFLCELLDWICATPLVQAARDNTDNTDSVDATAEASSISQFTPGKPQRLCETCKIACTKTRIFKCSRCHLACYCGRDCQRRHWNEHKAMCRPSTKEERLVHRQAALNSEADEISSAPIMERITQAFHVGGSVSTPVATL